MVEQDSNPTDTTADPTGSRWRPNATIDLKADKVHTEAVIGVTPDGPAAAGHPSQQSTDAGTASVEAVAAGLSEAAVPETRATLHAAGPDLGNASPLQPPPRSSAWSHVGAGAVGAILVGACLIALWSTGLVAPPDNRADAGKAQIADIATRLNEVSDRSRDTSAKITALTGRMTKLEQTAGAAPAPGLGIDPKIADRLAATEKAAKSLSGEVAELRRRADENAAATAQSTAGGIERPDLDDLTNRLAKLEASVQDELAKQNAALASARAMRYVVAATALRAAVDEGLPFKNELGLVKSLAPGGVSLAPLEAFAEAGVPRLQGLGKELTDLAPAMLRAAGATPKEGFLDRLQANAERLVRIRRLEESPGDDPVAIIGRIEIKAGRPDVVDTLAEFAKLPPAVRAPAEGWIKKTQTRQEAIDLSRRLQVDALNALGKE